MGQQKKIAKKGSTFFPIWAKNNFELGKKKNFVGQTPKLIHSRCAPVFKLNVLNDSFKLDDLNDLFKLDDFNDLFKPKFNQVLLA